MIGDIVQHHYVDKNGRLWVTDLETIEILPNFLKGKDYIYSCERDYPYDKPDEFWVEIDKTDCLKMKYPS